MFRSLAQTASGHLSQFRSGGLFGANHGSPSSDLARERIYLSKCTFTRHSLTSRGKANLVVKEGETAKLAPISETGSGAVQEKEKARLAEIIARLNDLSEGELTDNDRLVYVNGVIKGKLPESEELAQQARANTKAQFASSPILANEILTAVMDAFAAHTTMSKQALASEKIRDELKNILLGPAELYETLRARSQEGLSGQPGQ